MPSRTSRAIRAKAIEQHVQLARAIVQQRADEAADIARRHFLLTESALRELRVKVEGTEPDDPSFRLVLVRILLTLPALLAMSAFVFLLIRLVPGDPVRTMLGFRAMPENVAIVRADLHLDQSLPHQYVDWIGGAPAETSAPTTSATPRSRPPRPTASRSRSS